MREQARMDLGLPESKDPNSSCGWGDVSACLIYIRSTVLRLATVWQMNFNPEKCKVICITNKRKIIEGSYSIHEHTLQFTKELKLTSGVYYRLNVSTTRTGSKNYEH